MEPLRASFRAALENDLNTSLALTALYDVLKAKLSDADKLALIKEFDEVLSLGLLKAAKALREEQNAQKSAVPERQRTGQLPTRFAMRLPHAISL